jgi:excisionase family DNA binding protein
LRCSEKTIYNRVKSGEIKPLHNGKLVLFTKESLEEFLQRGGNKE